jgi:hypothetical protein
MGRQVVIPRHDARLAVDEKKGAPERTPNPNRETNRQHRMPTNRLAPEKPDAKYG